MLNNSALSSKLSELKLQLASRKLTEIKSEQRSEIPLEAFLLIYMKARPLVLTRDFSLTRALIRWLAPIAIPEVSDEHAAKYKAHTFVLPGFEVQRITDSLFSCLNYHTTDLKIASAQYAKLQLAVQITLLHKVLPKLYPLSLIKEN